MVDNGCFGSIVGLSREVNGMWAEMLACVVRNLGSRECFSSFIFCRSCRIALISTYLPSLATLNYSTPIYPLTSILSLLSFSSASKSIPFTTSNSYPVFSLSTSILPISTPIL